MTLDIARSTILAAAAPKGCRWVEDLDRKSPLHAVSRAFTGNAKVEGEPMMQWFVNHVTFPDFETKRHLIEYVLNYPMIASLPRPTFNFSLLLDNGTPATTVRVVAYTHPLPWYSSMLEQARIFCMNLKWTLTGRMPELLASRQLREECRIAKAKAEQADVDLHQWHAAHAPERHWYVQFVGTDPDFQGTGHGTAAMSVLHAAADAVGIDCYLEANGEKNREYYSKRGYELLVAKTIQNPLDETDVLETFLMLRKAKAL